MKQKNPSTVNKQSSQKEPKRVVKPQGSQTNQGKQDIAEVGKQPLSEAEAFKKAREEMVTAAKTLLDPTVTEAAKAELDRFKAMCGADNSDSDEATGSLESITTYTQSKQAPQAQQQQTSTSTMGPMQAYGPINIPPGTMIRRVQNLPAGAVPIDPSMLPPGMIPVHANHPNASSQSMPTADYAQGGSGKPRRTSEDSGKASEKHEADGNFIVTCERDITNTVMNPMSMQIINPTNTESVQTNHATSHAHGFEIDTPLESSSPTNSPKMVDEITDQGTPSKPKDGSSGEPPSPKAELCPPAPVMKDSWHKIKNAREIENVTNQSANQARDCATPSVMERALEGDKEDLVLETTNNEMKMANEWRFLGFHNAGDDPTKKSEMETIRYRTRDIGIVKGMINNKIELPFHTFAILDPKNRQILVLDQDQKITVIGRGCLWKPNFITATNRGNIAVFDLQEKAMKVFDTLGNYLAQIDEKSSQVM